VCNNKTFTIYEVRTQTYTVIYYVYEAIISVIDDKAVHKNFCFLSKTKNEEMKQRQVSKRKHTVLPGETKKKHIA
jgi:hypothetical protein